MDLLEHLKCWIILLIYMMMETFFQLWQVEVNESNIKMSFAAEFVSWEAAVCFGSQFWYLGLKALKNHYRISCSNPITMSSYQTCLHFCLKFSQLFVRVCVYNILKFSYSLRSSCILLALASEPSFKTAFLFCFWV